MQGAFTFLSIPIAVMDVCFGNLRPLLCTRRDRTIWKVRCIRRENAAEDNARVCPVHVRSWHGSRVSNCPILQLGLGFRLGGSKNAQHSVHECCRGRFDSPSRRRTQEENETAGYDSRRTEIRVCSRCKLARWLAFFFFLDEPCTDLP